MNSRRSHVDGTPIFSDACISISISLSRKFIYYPIVFLTRVGFSVNIPSSLMTRSCIRIRTFFKSRSEFDFSCRVAARNWSPPIFDINSRFPAKFSDLKKLLRDPKTATLLAISVSLTNWLIRPRAPSF